VTQAKRKQRAYPAGLGLLDDLVVFVKIVFTELFLDAPHDRFIRW
jgi:hypothetical protein